MRIVFRTKAGLEYGWGHIIRARTLALSLQERFDAAVLLVVDGDTGVRNHFDSLGVYVQFVDSQDDYQLAYEITIVNRFEPNVIIFDMLFVPEHILEQYTKLDVLVTLFNDLAIDYPQGDVIVAPQMTRESLVPRAGQMLLQGPKYFIANPQLLQAREKFKVREYAERILIYGGGSITRDNMYALRKMALSLRDQGFHITLLMGFDVSSTRSLEFIAFINEKNIEVVSGTNDISPLLLDSDIAIAASGYIKYELATVGVPAILFSIVDHQDMLGRQFTSAYNSAIFVGQLNSINLQELNITVETLASDTNLRGTLHRNGRSVIDGRGIHRIGDFLKSYLEEMAPA